VVKFSLLSERFAFVWRVGSDGAFAWAGNAPGLLDKESEFATPDRSGEPPADFETLAWFERTFPEADVSALPAAVSAFLDGRFAEAA
jgi:hypothetical protein